MRWRAHRLLNGKPFERAKDLIFCWPLTRRVPWKRATCRLAFAQSRLEVAKGVVSAFVEGRPNDRIGVVVFGEEAFTHVPLTLDHETLNNVLSQVQLGVAGAQGTAIGSAIAVGARRLKQIENPSRIMVLLTDGQNNQGELQPLDAADAAAVLGIRIYTVGIGSSGGGRGGFFGFLGMQMDLTNPHSRPSLKRQKASIFEQRRRGRYKNLRYH